MGKALDTAGSVLSTPYAITSTLVKKAKKYVAPGMPEIPASEETEAIKAEREQESAREAAARQAELEERVRKFGRPSTIKTSPIGIAGSGPQRTMLSTILGR